MKKEWILFYWPMVAVVVAIGAAAFALGSYYGPDFWEDFFPHLLAIVLGVVISIMFTWGIWRYQQRVQISEKRQRLIKDLKLEVAENQKRIEEMETRLSTRNVENGTPVEEVEFDIFGSIDMDDFPIRFMRAVAIEQLSRPENVLLIQDLDLEEKINWLFWRYKQYNATLSNALEEFNDNLNSSMELKEAISQMHNRILPGSKFLKRFLENLNKELSGFSV
ncbi:coiled-coil domain-containing protein [Chloroflexota bacterium]